jgi:cellobiose-specific phosphotransferase system component IIB
MFKKSIALFVCAALFTTSLLAGIDSHEAAYRGGTIATIEQGEEAKVDMKGSAFEWKSKKTPLTIPYDKIQSIEYGQKAGRRVGAAIGLGITTLGIGALPVLFSKKRNHMVTLSWTNTEGKTDAAVFELGKDIVREALTVLQARSGKSVEFESAEAKAHLGK